MTAWRGDQGELSCWEGRSRGAELLRHHWEERSRRAELLRHYCKERYISYRGSHVSFCFLLQNSVGQQESEHSLGTRGRFQYYTHNINDDEDAAAKTFQPGTPKGGLPLIPYRPDPLIPLIKYFMFILNSAFFTVGLAILCIGFWGLSTKQSLVAEKIGYLGTDPMLAFILVGLITCTLSFSGCVGFIRENTCLLKTFAVGIAVVIMAQCLVAVAVLCFQQQIQDSLKSTMLVAVSRYHDDSDLKFLLDEFQMGMGCCGVESYQDWAVNL